MRSAVIGGACAKGDSKVSDVAGSCAGWSVSFAQREGVLRHFGVRMGDWKP